MRISKDHNIITIKQQKRPKKFFNRNNALYSHQLLPTTFTKFSTLDSQSNSTINTYGFEIQ